jgi:hypothetical protein
VAVVLGTCGVLLFFLSPRVIRKIKQKQAASRKTDNSYLDGRSANFSISLQLCLFLCWRKRFPGNLHEKARLLSHFT